MLSRNPLKKSHRGPKCKSGDCEIHKSSSIVHNYIEKVYHCDTLLVSDYTTNCLQFRTKVSSDVSLGQSYPE